MCYLPRCRCIPRETFGKVELDYTRTRKNACPRCTRRTDHFRVSSQLLRQATWLSKQAIGNATHFIRWAEVMQLDDLLITKCSASPRRYMATLRSIQMPEETHSMYSGIHTGANIWSSVSSEKKSSSFWPRAASQGQSSVGAPSHTQPQGLSSLRLPRVGQMVNAAPLVALGVPKIPMVYASASNGMGGTAAAVAPPAALKPAPGAVGVTTAAIPAGDVPLAASTKASRSVSPPATPAAPSPVFQSSASLASSGSAVSMSTTNSTVNTSDDEIIPTAIVLKNIPFVIKKEELLEVMVQLGLPLPYAFNYHFDNGVFRGLAFANFATPEETAVVIANLNGRDIGGRKLRVEYKKILPFQERERIEREKRERRGQLEEQHQLVASPPPLSLADGKVDYNDPEMLELYSALLLFKHDPARADLQVPQPLSQRQVRALLAICTHLRLICVLKDSSIYISKPVGPVADITPALLRNAVSVSNMSGTQLTPTRVRSFNDLRQTWASPGRFPEAPYPPSSLGLYRQPARPQLGAIGQPASSSRDEKTL